MLVAGRLIDNEFFIGCPAGVMPRFDCQGAEMGNQSFSTPDDLLIKNRCRRRPVNEVRVRYTVLLKANSPCYVIQFHNSPPQDKPHFSHILGEL
jgi:hypothetical protein